MKRVRLIISGDVQGVGFRAWVKRQANDLGVMGWIINRKDGAVEIVAEGSQKKLEELVRRTRSGPDVALVADVQEEWSEPSGEYKEFSVVY